MTHKLTLTLNICFIVEKLTQLILVISSRLDCNFPLSICQGAEYVYYDTLKYAANCTKRGFSHATCSAKLREKIYICKIVDPNDVVFISIYLVYHFRRDYNARINVELHELLHATGTRVFGEE